MPAPARRPLLRLVPAILLGLALLPFFGLTGFAHPFLDDYHNANIVAEHGLWGAQLDLYQTWTGRFFSTALLTLGNPLAWAAASPGGLRGVGMAELLGLRALLLGWLGLHLLALQQFFRAWLLVVVGGGNEAEQAGPRGQNAPALTAAPLPAAAVEATSAAAAAEAAAARAQRRAASWGLAALVLALGLNAAPDVYALVYWFTGAAVYEVPWLLAVGFGACALRAGRLYRRLGPESGRGVGRRARRGWAAGAALCLLGAAAGNEVTLLYGLLGVAALGGWLWPVRAARRVWLSWALLGLLAGAATLAAPGNWRRAALTDPGPRARRWLLAAPRAGLTMLSLSARPTVAAALVLAAVAGLAVGGGVGARRPPHPLPAPSRRSWGLAGLGYLAFNSVGAGLLRLIWVEVPPGRVNNVLVFMLLLSTAAGACWAAPRLPAAARCVRGRPARLALLAGGLALGAVGQVGRAWHELLAVAPAYDRQMLARYARLRAARRQGGPALEAAVPPLRLPAVPGVLAPLPTPAGRRSDFSVELHPTPAGRDNQALAAYFGLRSVRLEAAPAPPQLRPRP